jgi:hypothetical protein
MKTNTINSSAAALWLASSPAREQFGIAPYGSQHGSGLPFSGSPKAVMTDAAATTHAARLVARKDDGKVPDPRERKR